MIDATQTPTIPEEKPVEMPTKATEDTQKKNSEATAGPNPDAVVAKADDSEAWNSRTLTLVAKPPAPDIQHRLRADGGSEWRYIYRAVLNFVSPRASREEFHKMMMDARSRAFALEALRVRHLISDKSEQALLRNTLCASWDALWTVRKPVLNLLDKTNRNARAEKIAAVLEFAKGKHPLTEKPKAQQKAHAAIRRAWFIADMLLSPIELGKLMPTMLATSAKFGVDKACANVIASENTFEFPIVGEFKKFYVNRMLANFVRFCAIPGRRPRFDGDLDAVERNETPCTEPDLCMMAYGDYIVKTSDWETIVADNGKKDNSFWLRALCKALYIGEAEEAQALIKKMYDVDVPLDELALVENPAIAEPLKQARSKRSSDNEKKRNKKKKASQRKKPVARKDNVVGKSPKTTAAKPDADKKRKREDGVGDEAPPRATDEVVMISEKRADNAVLDSALNLTQRNLPGLYYVVDGDKDRRYVEAYAAHSKEIKKFNDGTLVHSPDDAAVSFVVATQEANTAAAQKTWVLKSDGTSGMVTTQRKSLNMQSSRAQGKVVRDLLTSPTDSAATALSKGAATDMSGADNAFGAPIEFMSDPRLKSSASGALTKLRAATFAVRDSMTSRELHEFVDNTLLKNDAPMHVDDALRVIRAYRSIEKLVARVVVEMNRRNALFSRDIPSSRPEVEDRLLALGENSQFAKYYGYLMLHYANLNLVVSALLGTFSPGAESGDARADELRANMLKIPGIRSEGADNMFDPLVVWCDPVL